MGSQDVSYEEAAYGRQPPPSHPQRNSGGVELLGGTINSDFHDRGRGGDGDTVGGGAGESWPSDGVGGGEDES